jgi:1-phosphofructokinase
MAGNGALLVQSNGQTHRVKSPTGEVKNSAGAGDSMVAGYLAGLMWDLPPAEALALGAAAGSATAFSEGLATRAAIETIYKKIYGLDLPLEPLHS